MTIEAGVTIQFASDNYMKVEGALVAVGDNLHPITFTSNQVNKNMNDWNGIRIRPTGGTTFDGGDGYVSGSIIKYANIEHASTGLYIFYTGFLVTNSSFSNNATGIELRKTNHTVFQNNIFENNGTSIYSIYETYTGDLYGDIVDAKIQNNTFISGSYGIDLNNNQRTFQGIEISDNEFLEFTDYAIKIGGGGYGPYAHSIFIYGNWIHNNQNGIIIDTFYSNCFDNPNGWQCLDMPTYQIEIDNNFILNNTIYPLFVNFSENVRIRIYQNVLDGNGGEILFTGLQSAENEFLANSVHGITISVTEHECCGYGPNSWSIYNNLFQNIYSTTMDIFYGTNYPIYSNNFIDNGSFIIKNLTSSNIPATLNYWGTTDLSQIKAKIYDFYDNFELGEVIFNPIASVPNIIPPLSSPSGLHATRNSSEIVVNWIANPESDVVGYKVYYDTDADYPYANVINVGNFFSTTLRDLPHDVYHISITAYDSSADGNNDWTDGNESWFSKSIRISLLPSIFLPLTFR